MINMAQEYVLSKEKSELGNIAINKKVFELIAQIEVEEEAPNVLPDNSRFKNAVNCKITKDQLILTLDLKVAYSKNVNDICAKLQNRIIDSIKHMSGYDVDQVDIKVTGFIFN